MYILLFIFLCGFAFADTSKSMPNVHQITIQNSEEKDNTLYRKRKGKDGKKRRVGGRGLR